MDKLHYLEMLIDFLPELFPPDLSAITLSNCTHFISIWTRKDNALGESLKKLIYPGKPLELNVMLGQVAKRKEKITKYYTKDESISGIPYLAVGVPIYEGEDMVGGIAVVREETILETQERCKNLLEVQETLAQSMITVSSRLSNLVKSYRETRTITNYVQDISQQALLLGINSLVGTSQSNQNGDVIKDVVKELQNLVVESKKTTGKIVNLLNDFDDQNIGLFSSIQNIETIVNNMTDSVNDIMDYLKQQSNMIMHGK